MTLTPYQFARNIEEASLNAWPAIEQLLYDGWILRFAKGYSRRNNSVNALYSGTLPPAQKISRCEAIYSDRGLPPTFRLTPFVQPLKLDSMLVEAGYQKVSPTSVQLKTLSKLSPPPDLMEAEQYDLPTEEWVTAYTRMNSVPPAKHAALRAILTHIPYPATYATVRGETGQPAACGLGVFDGQYVGLFDIVTDPAQRGKGLGQAVIWNILLWAKQQGASHAYLQVVADNTPAVRLYARLGFREIYQYWYRVLGPS